MDKLTFYVSGLADGLSEHRFELQPIDLNLENIEIGVLATIEVELSVSRTREEFQVRGSIATRIEQKCMRCLSRMNTDLNPAVELVVRPYRISDDAQTDRKGTGKRKAAGRDEVEKFESAPEGMLFHNGETFSLNEEIRQLILVEIPGVPVCSRNCAGLCPHCGVNRNAESCSCAAGEAGDQRWAALRGLRRESDGK